VPERIVMKPIRRRAADRRLQQDVEDALELTRDLDTSDIKVVVAAGVVTIGGSVLTLADKLTAGGVAARVFGVKAVANDLTLRFLGADAPTNTEIARTAVAALGWNILVPKNAITVVVDDGWLALEGLVDWQYQKHLAGREVRGVAGVRGVTNNIVVRPGLRPVRAGDINDETMFPTKMRTH
jgi:osmotically-inducible protein OsmY